MFFEMEGCLDNWTSRLKKEGKLTNYIINKKKEFKNALKSVGGDQLKEIRNRIAFH